MEGQYNTQLHSEGTQSRGLNTTIRIFNIQDYFANLESQIHSDKDTILDTNVIMDISSRDLEKLLDRDAFLVDGFLESVVGRNNMFFENVIRLIRSNRNLFVNLGVIRELEGNKRGCSEVALKAERVLYDKNDVKGDFLRMLLDYSDKNSLIINLLSSRASQHSHGSNHSPILRNLRENLGEYKNGKASHEDRDLMYFFIANSLKRPSTLISKDRDLAYLYNLSTNHLVQVDRDIRVKLHPGHKVFYLAKDELYKKVVRSFVFLSDLR